MDSLQNNGAVVQSVFVGLPKKAGSQDAEQPMEREWVSSIFKEPISGPVYLGKTNLMGDEQADLKNHGGPEKAVFSYPSEHYDYWQETQGYSDMAPGGMGENFSTVHLQEADIAIGDTFQIGHAVIQVSQPRRPCWKPARRYRVKDLAVQIQDTGRTGWYYRVLQEGWVEAGDRLQPMSRPAPKWTVARCNELMHKDVQNFEQAAELAALEELAVNWRTTLQKRVDTRKEKDIGARVYGPNAE